MAQMGRLARSVAKLLEAKGTGDRFVDMGISLRLADVDELPNGEKRWRTETEEELIRLGGRWDTKAKRWAGEARTGVIYRVHRGQEQGARWLADWIRRRCTGDWSSFRRVSSILLVGGRRS